LLEVGQNAPDFSLKDIGAQPWSFDDHLEKGRVLVNFFKISCPTCQLTLPFLERLNPTVTVVGISQDDAPSTKEFLDYYKITFPVLIDPKKDRYRASNAYRITNVPSIFLIEKDKTISWTLSGFHRGDLEALAAKLGTVLFTANDRVPAMKPG
jgi:peroxiredoxin